MEIFKMTISASVRKNEIDMTGVEYSCPGVEIVEQTGVGAQLTRVAGEWCPNAFNGHSTIMLIII
jgi:hypothetical protein